MTAAPELIEIRLLEIPVALRYRSQQHGEELVREMTLISQQAEHFGRESIPNQLVQLAAEVKTTYGKFSAAADEQFEDARARGLEVMPEMVYRLPPTITAFSRHLIKIMDEADEFCRQGQHLLTLATPPDIAAYRMWVLTEIGRQASGQPPTPWPQYTPDA